MQFSGHLALVLALSELGAALAGPVRPMAPAVSSVAPLAAILLVIVARPMLIVYPFGL